jgi:flagellar protein FliS
VTRGGAGPEGAREEEGLEKGGELAKNLDELYNYVTRRLLHVNARNDLQALDEIYGLMIEIRSAWESVPALIPRTPQPSAVMN